MNTTNLAPVATISALLSVFPADPVADALAAVARSSALLLVDEGFGGSGCESDYSIAVYHGDREDAENLLGRKLDRAETTALEACIKAHLAALTA